VLQCQRNVVTLAHSHVARQYNLHLNVKCRPKVVRARHINTNTRILRSRHIIKQSITISVPIIPVADCTHIS
jgi:hypothetical protein